MIEKLLNIVFDASEQMFSADFGSFWEIIFDLIAFLGLIRFSSLSVSDKPLI